MLTFIYLACSMMALLYETVPAFEDTWIEYLGDLGRCRMAIEDDDIRDREVSQNVARWYSKAADKSPGVGRLYHHLAILARPNILQQLFYYCKSLGVTQPFSSARESILTVFDPIFNPDVFSSRSQPVDASFIQLHSVTFSRIELEKFGYALDEFLGLLGKHINAPGSKWKVEGFYMSVCNITALYQYGARDSLLRKAWKEGRKAHTSGEAGVAGDEEMEEAPHADAEAETIATLLPPYGTSGGHIYPTDEEELDPGSAGLGDIPQCFQTPGVHCSRPCAIASTTPIPCLIPTPGWSLSSIFTGSVPAMRLIENEFPWKSLVDMLNDMFLHYDGRAEKIEDKTFPDPGWGVGRPLPEDYNLRGFDWAKRYFPDRWFEDAHIDNEERTQGLPSMTSIRRERILWLALRICAAGDRMVYDSKIGTFYLHSALVQRMEEARKRAIAAAAARRIKHGGSPAYDEDVDMTETKHSNSDKDGYVMVPKVKELKEKKRQLETQLQVGIAGHVITPEAIAEVSRSAIVKGPEALDPDITAFIVDTNLVSHLETFNLVTKEGWAVIFPNSVITELLGLGNNFSIGGSAKSAMIAINKAIADKANIRIITARENDVTKAGFFREKVERDENEIRNTDDVIIRTTRHQAESRRQAFAAKGAIGYAAQPAILLTEDTNMRVKANARGVSAISTTILKNFLAQLRSKRLPTRRPDINEVFPLIKSEYDEHDLPMADAPQFKDSKHLTSHLVEPRLKMEGHRAR